MRKADVHIGGWYVAKISGQLVKVWIMREDPSGGWEAQNLKTKRFVRIKSARKLRAYVPVAER